MVRSVFLDEKYAQIVIIYIRRAIVILNDS